MSFNRWKAERCILQPGSELLPYYNGLTCCFNGTRRAFCCPKDYWDPNTGNQDPSYLELLALDDIQKLTTMRTVEEESLKQRELVEPDPSRMELMSTDDIQKMTMMSIVENEYLQMPKLVKPDPFRMELMSTDDINELSMMRTVEDESLQQPKLVEHLWKMITLIRSTSICSDHDISNSPMLITVSSVA